MKIKCEFTGCEMTIVHLHNLDDRMWRFLDAKGLKLHIARSCIVNCDQLLLEFSDGMFYRMVDPEDYLNWLYGQAMENNPQLQEKVEGWLASYEQPYSIHSSVQP
jgi:hypothetical protein